jgi:hypothetical protein
LRRQWNERLDDDPDASSGPPNCPEPTNQLVVPGSSTGAGFDFLAILVPAYAAGADVEGEYVVRLAVTSAVIQAIRPEYRHDFRILRDGAMLGHPFEAMGAICKW